MTTNFKFYYEELTGKIVGSQSVIAPPMVKLEAYPFIEVSYDIGLEIRKDANNYQAVRNLNRSDEYIIKKKENEILVRQHDSYFYKIPLIKRGGKHKGLIIDTKRQKGTIWMFSMGELIPHNCSKVEKDQILKFYVTKKDDPDFLIDSFDVLFELVEMAPIMIEMNGLPKSFGIFTRRVFKNYYMI